MPSDSTATGIYAPTYYNDFACIADRCRHSCCIDWEICIDDDTLAKYRPIQAIMSTVTACEDGRCFALTEDGRCPHLNEAGLCEIILAHGDAYLSDICRLHPRFFQAVSAGRTEAGLGLVCEEVCRLILENEQPFSLVKIGDIGDGTVPDMEFEGDLPDGFKPLPQRDAIIHRIEHSAAHFRETRAALQEAFNLSEIYTPDEWIDRFLALEILDAHWAQVLQAAKGSPAPSPQERGDAYDPYYRRLLTYFVYRHVSVAESPENLRARLAFALLSVDMIRYLFDREPDRSLTALMDLARCYSAEIEYSEDNTAELIFACECRL